jgi:hypothetical protein
LAIVTLVLWVITAGAGVSLLSTGGAARRRAARAAQERQVSVAAPQTAGASASTSPAAGPLPSGLAARLGAPPRTADGKPPPVPRVTVATPPGEHPLLEFSHPALAVTGLACWMMFVFVHYRPLAWISFGILIVTIGLGLGWLSRNTRDARQHTSAAWRFPPRLVATHGTAAAVSIALTVLTALTASRG